MSVPVYIAETTPARHRGSMVTFNNLLITGGQFTASLIGGIFAYTREGWRYMFGIAAIPAILQFFGFMLMPESPRFLIQKGRFDEATKVLAQTRNPSDNIHSEFEDIKLSTFSDESTSVKSLLTKIFETPSVRKALIIGCLLQLFQQLSGINTVMYYSASIIQMTGVTRDNGQAIWISTITALFNFLATFIGLYYVDKKGRRPLLIGSFIGVTISLLCLSFSFRIMNPVILYSNECNTHVVDSCQSCVAFQNCGFCYNSTDLDQAGICVALNSTECVTSIIGRDYCPTKGVGGFFIAIISLCAYLLFFAPGLGNYFYLFSIFFLII